MNVFTKDRGVHQGRIAKANAPEGVYVYELGHALLAERTVEIGDSHRVSQTFMRDVNAKYVRASIVIVTPPVLPSNAVWEVSGWVNDERMVVRRLRRSKRVITLDDWRLRVADLPPPPSPTTVMFQLMLVEMQESDAPA